MGGAGRALHFIQALLCSIHSEEENSFVAAIQNKWTWTGATNVGNCTWAWTDGTAWDYENWGTSEPDCQGDLNCAEIGYHNILFVTEV